jgi:hypothetical protein
MFKLEEGCIYRVMGDENRVCERGGGGLYRLTRDRVWIFEICFQIFWAQTVKMTIFSIQTTSFKFKLKIIDQSKCDTATGRARQWRAVLRPPQPQCGRSVPLQATRPATSATPGGTNPAGVDIDRRLGDKAPTETSLMHKSKRTYLCSRAKSTIFIHMTFYLSLTTHVIDIRKTLSWHVLLPRGKGMHKLCITTASQYCSNRSQPTAAPCCWH